MWERVDNRSTINKSLQEIIKDHKKLTLFVQDEQSLMFSPNP